MKSSKAIALAGRRGAFVTHQLRNYGGVRCNPIGDMVRLQSFYNHNAEIRPFQRSQDEVLEVTCWCEREIVHVPASLIVQGITNTCGAIGCAP